jgi:hypothetical protein
MAGRGAAFHHPGLVGLDQRLACVILMILASACSPPTPSSGPATSPAEVGSLSVPVQVDSGPSAPIARRSRTSLDAACTRRAGRPARAGSRSRSRSDPAGRSRRSRTPGDHRSASDRLLSAQRRHHRHDPRGRSARLRSDYTGACLKPNVGDYDCGGGSGEPPFLWEPVRVVGVDPFGLDRDGDGWGCEAS